MPCPCGSEKKYKKCCRVFHDKKALASLASELMRSRYSAFATKNADYIIETTHKDNPDFTVDINSWRADVLAFCEYTVFEKLDVLEFIEGEFESFVTFKATLKQDKKDVSFTEKSRFLKENGKWFYVDGTFL